MSSNEIRLIAHLMRRAGFGATRDELDELFTWILDHLDEDLSVEMLADRACVTSRHLNRLFTARRGVTPAVRVPGAGGDYAGSCAGGHSRGLRSLSTSSPGGLLRSHALWSSSRAGPTSETRAPSAT